MITIVRILSTTLAHWRGFLVKRESRRHIGPHRPSAALAAGPIDYFRDYEYLYLWVLHAQMDEYQRRGEIRRFNVRWANLRRTTSAILC
jgi:hypothetical protein